MAQFTVLCVLAMRNLRRHVRRTILTASAMIIGGGLLITSIALGDGTHEEWIDSGVRTGTGHVTIEHPHFHVSHSLEDRLPADVRALALHALQDPDIASSISAVSTKIVVQGLASSPAGARPAQVMGVDPEHEPAFGLIDAQTVEGRYLEPDDELAAYIGIGLAETLDLRLGSRLVLSAQDANREIVGQLVRVVGIYRNGVPEVDESLIHIPLKTAAEWLSTAQDVTSVGVVLTESTRVAGVVRQLRTDLAEPVADGRVTVMSWREAMPALAAAVAVDDFGNYLVYGILFVIIGFGIVNTVLMSVLHRYREFGVLQALGLTPLQTGTVVLIEGLVLTAVSAAAGLALGIGLTWYFFGDGLDFSIFMENEMTASGVLIDPVVIPIVRVSRVVQSALFVLGIGTVASLYPAYRAARIDVTESMKFER